MLSRGPVTNTVCFPSAALSTQVCWSQVAIAPLRRSGMHLAVYLDNWLLLARSRQED